MASVSGTRPAITRTQAANAHVVRLWFGEYGTPKGFWVESSEKQTERTQRCVGEFPRKKKLAFRVRQEVPATTSAHFLLSRAVTTRTPEHAPPHLRKAPICLRPPFSRSFHPHRTSSSFPARRASLRLLNNIADECFGLVGYANWFH